MGKIIDAIVIFLYPLIVVIGMNTIGIRLTALIILLFLGRRIIGLVIANKEGTRIVLYQVIAMAVIVGLAGASKSAFALRAAPFMISLTFITTFGMSLKTTPIIERFARLQDPTLSEAEARYCRKLTIAWMFVLFANSVLVLCAAFVENALLWSILVGPASYALLGSPFVVEYPYRKWRFRKFNDKNPIDRLLRRVIEGRAA
jgi:uncharacterized membrane protein